MTNAYGVPEISVKEMAARLAAGDVFLLMDVREQMELRFAKLKADTEWVPLSRLANLRVEALPTAMKDKDLEVVVFCHHGIRSAQVTAWLINEGYTNVRSLAGGIDAYAREIDPSVGFY